MSTQLYYRLYHFAPYHVKERLRILPKHNSLSGETNNNTAFQLHTAQD